MGVNKFSNGPLVEPFDSFLFDDCLPLGFEALKVDHCPRALASGVPAQVVVVLPEPTLGVLGNSLVVIRTFVSSIFRN